MFKGKVEPVPRKSRAHSWKSRPIYRVTVVSKVYMPYVSCKNMDLIFYILEKAKKTWIDFLQAKKTFKSMNSHFLQAGTFFERAFTFLEYLLPSRNEIYFS